MGYRLAQFVAGGKRVAAEEVSKGHGAAPGRLNVEQFDAAYATGDCQIVLAVRQQEDCTGRRWGPKGARIRQGANA